MFGELSHSFFGVGVGVIFLISKPPLHVHGCKVMSCDKVGY